MRNIASKFNEGLGNSSKDVQDLRNDSRKSGWGDVVLKGNPLRFLVLSGSIAVAAFLALSFFALLTYQKSVLSHPDRYQELNAYWEEKLDLATLSFPLGAHYWHEDDLVSASSDGFLVRAEWLGSRFSGLEQFRSLPDDFDKPARFIHQQGALAGRNKLYHWQEGKGWASLLEGFRAWHTSVEYLQNNILMVGEYEDRVKFFNLDDLSVTRTSHKPEDTRHFHLVRKDPYTGYLYASLGDSHTHFVTGIMTSRDDGKSWGWLHKTRRGLESTHRQPTAIYFLQDKILFGSDSAPDGIYYYDKSSGEFHQPFVMKPILKSWFTDIKQHEGVFWAISRSFGQRPAFGVLWSSVDGDDWQPVQVFEKVPMWLEHNSQGVMTVGFSGENPGIVFQSPGIQVIERHLEKKPSLNIGAIEKYWLGFSRRWVDAFKDIVRLVYRSP